MNKGEHNQMAVTFHTMALDDNHDLPPDKVKLLQRSTKKLGTMLRRRSKLAFVGCKLAEVRSYLVLVCKEVKRTGDAHEAADSYGKRACTGSRLQG